MTIIIKDYETLTLERSVYINETFKLPPNPPPRTEYMHYIPETVILISCMILVIKLCKKFKRTKRSPSLIFSVLYEHDISFLKRRNLD